MAERGEKVQALDEQLVPPPGEEIHLPGPSLLPLLLAVGITLALIGITISIVLVVAGLAIAIPTVVQWIRTTQADIAELPPEHH